MGGATATDDASFDEGTYRLSGAGAGVTGVHDQFQFVYRTLAGDGEITARFSSGTAGLQEGLMMRDTLEPDAPYAFIGAMAARWTFLSRNAATTPAAIREQSAGGAGPVWLRLVRRGDVFAGYYSVDGKAWSQFSTAAISMGGEIYVGLAEAGTDISAAAFDDVRVRRSDIPSPWVATDIGPPVLFGFDRNRRNAFILNGGGAGIGGRSDEFHFVSRPISGDGSITAYVRGPGAVAGLMFRGGLEPDSPNVALTLQPDGGAALRWRTAAGKPEDASTLLAGLDGPWIRLVRVGDGFAGYSSPDGVAWTLGGTVILPLAETLDAGLSVSGQDETVLGTATFKDVEAGPGNPAN